MSRRHPDVCLPPGVATKPNGQPLPQAQRVANLHHAYHFDRKPTRAYIPGALVCVAIFAYNGWKAPEKVPAEKAAAAE